MTIQNIYHMSGVDRKSAVFIGNEQLFIHSLTHKRTQFYILVQTRTGEVI